MLYKSQSLLAVVTRLLSLSNNRVNILKWCKIIDLQPRNRRAIFATLLIKSGVYTIDADTVCQEAIDKFNEITPKVYYSARLYFFLLGIKRGVSVGYLLDGFTLANKYIK